METVRLGKSGLRVSALCLGCMNFGESTPEAAATEILQTAFEAGVTFWDTADIYAAGASEEIMGRAIKSLGLPRDKIVLATKLNGPTGVSAASGRGLGRSSIRQCLEASLRRLQTDYIDLYQMHRYDPGTPMEETLDTLDALTREGKIRYVGTSTFTSWMMAEAHYKAQMHGRVGPICEQAPYNILDRRLENDRLGFLQREGWGLVAWSPLAGGQLTGRYGKVGAGEALPTGSRIDRMKMWRERINADAGAVSQAYVELCRGYDLEPAQAAVAWLRHRPIPVVPIVGPRTLEQFTRLLPAAALSLPSGFLEEIDALVPPGTAVADFLNNSGWQVGRLAGLDSRR